MRLVLLSLAFLALLTLAAAAEDDSPLKSLTTGNRQPRLGSRGAAGHCRTRLLHRCADRTGSGADGRALHVRRRNRPHATIHAISSFGPIGATAAPAPIAAFVGQYRTPITSMTRIDRSSRIAFDLALLKLDQPVRNDRIQSVRDRWPPAQGRRGRRGLLRP